MEKLTFPRTGDRALACEGEILAEAETSLDSNHNRAFGATLARTKGGNFVVAVSYRTRWEQERNIDFAVACPAEDAVVEWLQDFDPMQWVSGYPVGTHDWEKKQKRLCSAITAQWAEVKGKLLSAFGPELVD